MQKFVTDALFGLAFGIGFSLAAAICHLLAMLFQQASK
jgi:hypothetical protein